MPELVDQFAVATGDVIASTEFARRPDLPQILREAFAAVERRVGPPVRAFEIYRSDSFQGVFEPRQALLVATIVRARLRSERRVDRRRASALDARIAIGIGTIEYSAPRVVESDGEAYRVSGHGLDEMARSKDTRRLSVAGPQVPMQAQITVQLLDTIIREWTVPAAESMFLALTEPDQTQAELARRLDVSQPAVSQRLRAARFDNVQELLELFSKALTLASS